MNPIVAINSDVFLSKTAAEEGRSTVDVGFPQRVCYCGCWVTLTFFLLWMLVITFHPIYKSVVEFGCWDLAQGTLLVVATLYNSLTLRSEV